MESRKPPLVPEPTALAERVPPGTRPSTEDWLDLAWVCATRGAATSFEPLLVVEAALTEWHGPAPWEPDTFLESVAAARARANAQPPRRGVGSVEAPAERRSDATRSDTTQTDLARSGEGHTDGTSEAATGERVWRRLLHWATEAPSPQLRTKWLRQLPREDSNAVFTGNLADVFEEPDLEAATLRLSQVLRVIHTREYGSELILEAGAWDLEPPAGYGLECALAAVGLAAWGSADATRAERGRAVLLRWLSQSYARGAAIPFRPREEAEPPGEQALPDARALWDRIAPHVSTKKRSVLLGLRAQNEWEPAAELSKSASRQMLLMEAVGGLGVGREAEEAVDEVSVVSPCLLRVRRYWRLWAASEQTRQGNR